MLEFLISQNSSENPTFISILLAVLSSFFLSFLIVGTYQITTRNFNRPSNFIQSLALISIVAATVMQAIGDSLARGLGMLGALAIIRFRTRLDNPRNMTFMFASLAVGISCGVFGFTIAFVGTVVFCLAAILIHFSKFMNSDEKGGSLRFVFPVNFDHHQAIEKLISDHCTRFRVNQYRLNDSAAEDSDNEEEQSEPGTLLFKEVTYDLIFRSEQDSVNLVDELRKFPYIRDIRIRFNTEPDQI